MKKRMLGLVLAVCLTALAAPEALASHSESGSAALKKLSQAEIETLLESAPHISDADIFEEMPSAFSPYKAGSVKTAVLQQAVDRLNALRRIAGLPAVILDAELSEKARRGTAGRIRVQPPSCKAGRYGPWF